MEFIRSCILLWLLTPTTFAAPAPPDVTTYSYGRLDLAIAPEPRGRGTFSIIFSCAATFFFCVWTAVHPNVIPNVSSGYRVFHKSVLMAISIVVPEGVMVCAVGEWLEAREVYAAARKHNIPVDCFDMGVAFFVVMGGLVIEVTNDAGIPSFYTITTEGFIHYIDNDHQINVNLFRKGSTLDKRSILDKGKASNIAKVLAGLQALWLFVQCLSRWASKLPLTLLEFHVGIQVLCTVVIYLFWFHKPLDVNEPIMVQIEDAKQELQSDLNEDFLRPVREWSDTERKYMTVLAKAFYDIANHIGNHKRAMLGEGMLILFIGASHAAAWGKNYFPTDLECYFWRGASLGMCFLPLGAVFLAACNNYHQDLSNALSNVCRTGTSHGIISVTWGEICSVCDVRSHGKGWLYFVHFLLIWASLIFIILYFVCIAFITMESFISMRKPDPRSFLTPVWSDYWPHI